MSGIVKSGGEDFIQPSQTKLPVSPSKERPAAPIDIAKQGVLAVKEKNPIPILHKLEAAQKTVNTLDVQKIVSQMPHPHLTREQVTARLFAHMQPLAVDPKKLLNDLEAGIGQFNQDAHSFQVGSQVVFITKRKADDPLVAGVAHIVKKGYVAEGGYGKLYPVSSLDAAESGLLFKLSRKKEKGGFGEVSRRDLHREFEFMKYIKSKASSLEGLNVESFGLVTFNNQAGYFVKKFDSDLFNYLKKSPSSEVRYNIMKQMVSGLNMLHKLAIIHRDIKLENVLIKENKEGVLAGISDFGNAVQVKELFARIPDPTIGNLVGSATHIYVSKHLTRQLGKLLRGKISLKKVHNVMKKNDLFALGITLYILWTGFAPDFKSFEAQKYFAFDKGLTKAQKEEKLDEMKSEIFAVTSDISFNKHKDAYFVQNTVMEWIKGGLDLS